MALHPSDIFLDSEDIGLSTRDDAITIHVAYRTKNFIDPFISLRMKTCLSIGFVLKFLSMYIYPSMVIE